MLENEGFLIKFATFSDFFAELCEKANILKIRLFFMGKELENREILEGTAENS